MTRSTHSTHNSTQERGSPRSQPPKVTAQAEHANASSSSVRSSSSSSTPDSVEDLDNGGTEPVCCHRRIAIMPRDITYIGYGICIGGIGSVCWKFLKENGIKNILSIGLKPADELPNSYFKKCEYIAIHDDSRAKGHIGNFFKEAVNYIEEGTKGDDIILVHCHGGETRSVAAAAEYLHKKKGFRRSQALLWIASKRPQTDPHSTFVQYMADEARREGEIFSIPGYEEGKPFRWNREEISKFLKKANHDELFAGCEKDTRKGFQLTFRTEEGKKVVG